MQTPLLIPQSVAIRSATMGDLPFIDQLQKMHTKMVGWMPTKQLEGKIASGNVLVAECRVGFIPTDSGGDGKRGGDEPYPTPVGYCIGHDQYFKRDDVGIIYQMNVVPGKQRGLIGASLLKAQFERSAYGCKLYCCWCAQDIGANQFWEAMGFVPLAFRTGSAEKSRTHIFWQRRIRQGDVTTPYWFPSQTSAGSIREDRLVLPIPPGMHWSDSMPQVLPRKTPALSAVEGRQIGSTKSETKKKKPVVTTRLRGGMQFPGPKIEPLKAPKVKAPRVARKNDPHLVAAARELRDRWLEEVNAGRYAPAMAEKYEVGRALMSESNAPLLQPPQKLAA